MKSHTTILSLTFGFLIINIFLNSDYLFYSILLIIRISLISNKFSSIIEIIWLKFSFILSKIIPNILLSIIYYFLLTPISFLSKLFNSKTEFKDKNDSNSMFINVNKKFNRNSFEKGW